MKGVSHNLYILTVGDTVVAWGMKKNIIKDRTQAIIKYTEAKARGERHEYLRPRVYRRLWVDEFDSEDPA